MAAGNLTGKRFGLLVVESKANDGVVFRKLKWICRCDCGNTTLVLAGNLRSNKRGTLSCGCKQGNRKHGLSQTPTYKSWNSMIARCTHPNDNGYDGYGGRGITICERWMKFENFLADMGEKPKDKSLDRKDNNKGYYKENCRWATPEQQQGNTRANHWIEFRGERLIATDWARRMGHPSVTPILQRLARGWSVEDAITLPIMRSRNHLFQICHNGRTMSAGDWAAGVGVSLRIIWQRLDGGRDIVTGRKKRS